MDTPYSFIPKKRDAHVSRQSNNKQNRLELPIPPDDIDQRFELDIYVRFMRYLRHMPNRQMDLQILCAIESVADTTKTPAELVAKALVDMGLKAPKSAFPKSFVEFCMQSIARINCPVTGPRQEIREILRHWQATDSHIDQSSKGERRPCECKQFETVMM